MLLLLPSRLLLLVVLFTLISSSICSESCSASSSTSIIISIPPETAEFRIPALSSGHHVLTGAKLLRLNISFDIPAQVTIEINNSTIAGIQIGDVSVDGTVVIRNCLVSGIVAVVNLAVTGKFLFVDNHFVNAFTFPALRVPSGAAGARSSAARVLESIFSTARAAEGTDGFSYFIGTRFIFHNTPEQRAASYLTPTFAVVNISNNSGMFVRYNTSNGCPPMTVFPLGGSLLMRELVSIGVVGANIRTLLVEGNKFGGGGGTMCSEVLLSVTVMNCSGGETISVSRNEARDVTLVTMGFRICLRHVSDFDVVRMDHNALSTANDSWSLNNSSFSGIALENCAIAVEENVVANIRTISMRRNSIVSHHFTEGVVMRIVGLATDERGTKHVPRFEKIGQIALDDNIFAFWHNPRIREREHFKLGTIVSPLRSKETAALILTLQYGAQVADVGVVSLSGNRITRPKCGAGVSFLLPAVSPDCMMCLNRNINNDNASACMGFKNCVHDSSAVRRIGWIRVNNNTIISDPQHPDDLLYCWESAFLQVYLRAVSSVAKLEISSNVVDAFFTNGQAISFKLYQNSLNIAVINFSSNALTLRPRKLDLSSGSPQLDRANNIVTLSFDVKIWPIGGSPRPAVVLFQRNHVLVFAQNYGHCSALSLVFENTSSADVEATPIVRVLDNDFRVMGGSVVLFVGSLAVAAIAVKGGALNDFLVHRNRMSMLGTERCSGTVGCSGIGFFLSETTTATAFDIANNSFVVHTTSNLAAAILCVLFAAVTTQPGVIPPSEQDGIDPLALVTGGPLQTMRLRLFPATARIISIRIANNVAEMSCPTTCRFAVLVANGVADVAGSFTVHRNKINITKLTPAEGVGKISKFAREMTTLVGAVLTISEPPLETVIELTPAFAAAFRLDLPDMVWNLPQIYLGVKLLANFDTRIEMKHCLVSENEIVLRGAVNSVFAVGVNLVNNGSSSSTACGGSGTLTFRRNFISCSLRDSPSADDSDVSRLKNSEEEQHLCTYFAANSSYPLRAVVCIVDQTYSGAIAGLQASAGASNAVLTLILRRVSSRIVVMNNNSNSHGLPSIVPFVGVSGRESVSAQLHLTIEDSSVLVESPVAVPFVSDRVSSGSSISITNSNFTLKQTPSYRTVVFNTTFLLLPHFTSVAVNEKCSFAVERLALPEGALTDPRQQSIGALVDFVSSHQNSESEDKPTSAQTQQRRRSGPWFNISSSTRIFDSGTIDDFYRLVRFIDVPSARVMEERKRRQLQQQFGGAVGCLIWGSSTTAEAGQFIRSYSSFFSRSVDASASSVFVSSSSSGDSSSAFRFLAEVKEQRCPRTESASVSQSASLVPECSDFFFLPDARSSRMIVDDVAGTSGVEITWFLLTSNHRDTPAPLAAGGRTIVGGKPGVSEDSLRQEAGAAFTVFRDLSRTSSSFRVSYGNETTTTAARIDTDSRKVDVLVATPDVASVGATMSSNGSSGVTTRVGPSDVRISRNRMSISFRFQADMPTDEESGSATLRIFVSKRLLACRVAPGKNSDWWAEAKVQLISRGRSLMSRDFQAGAKTLGNLAAIVSLIMPDGAMVATTLSRTSALTDIFVCRKSKTDRPLSFLESPLGIQISSSKTGRFLAGAVIGNFLLTALLVIPLILLGFRNRQNAVKEKFEELTRKSEEGKLRAEKRLQRERITTATPAASSVNENNNNRVTEKSLLDAAKAQAMPFRDALGMAKFPSLLMIPLSSLAQGTISSAVGLLFMPSFVGIGWMGIGFQLAIVAFIAWIVFVAVRRQRQTLKFHWFSTQERARLPPANPDLLNKVLGRFFGGCTECEKTILSRQTATTIQPRRSRPETAAAAAAATTAEHLLPSRDLTHRTTVLETIVHFLMTHFFYFQGEWRVEQHKISRRSDADPVVIQRYTLFFAKNHGRATWYALFDFVCVGMAIGIISGLQKYRFDCSDALMFLVSIIIVISLIVRLHSWPSLRNAANVYSAVVGALMVLICLIGLWANFRDDGVAYGLIAVLLSIVQLVSSALCLLDFLFFATTAGAPMIHLLRAVLVHVSRHRKFAAAPAGIGASQQPTLGDIEMMPNSQACRRTPPPTVNRTANSGARAPRYGNRHSAPLAWTDFAVDL